MKKICVLTATRAEYGLLKRLIHQLKCEETFDVRIVVTGAHLSPEFGLTYKDIEDDGFEIDEKIEMLLSSDSPAAISKSMGLAMIGFADYFERTKPDLLVVLGDRYETLAVSCTAMNQRIPIAHLYGGETTEGAIDDVIRHAITKLSYLHFTSTEIYRKRVIQLGEDPARVFFVGSLGVENILNEKLFKKSDLEESLQWKLNHPYAVVTFHPETLAMESAEKQTAEMLKAIERNPQYQYLFTKANADCEGRIINQMIEQFEQSHCNCKVVASLGVKRFLTAVKNASFVLGNSSSGIIEAPSLNVPTINIGDRQKGRIQAASVVNCKAECDEIDQCIKLVSSWHVEKSSNPYEKQDTTLVITEIIKDFFIKNAFSANKKFYELEHRN